MSEASFKFEKANRSLMERLFEPPAVGKMSPVANVVALCPARRLVALRAVPDLLGDHHVLQGRGRREPGAVLHSVRGFPADARMPGGPSSTPIPICDLPSIARQFGLLVYNTFAFIVSPVVTLQPMEPQICKIFLAFTNSIVVSVAATAVCVAIGSMAAYALARIQYKPKFGNIMMFVALTLAGHCRHQLCRRSLVGFRRRGACPVLLPRARLRQALHRAPWAMATSCSGSFRSASCRPSSWSFRST